MSLDQILNILVAVAVFVIIAVIIGLGLALADKFLQVIKDIRSETVEKMLPGLNCGACGYPGCAGMTEGLLSGEAKKVSQCKPSNKAQREAIRDYLAATPGPDGSVIKVAAE